MNKLFLVNQSLESKIPSPIFIKSIYLYSLGIIVQYWNEDLAYISFHTVHFQFLFSQIGSFSFYMQIKMVLYYSLKSIRCLRKNFWVIWWGAWATYCLSCKEYMIMLIWWNETWQFYKKCFLEMTSVLIDVHEKHMTHWCSWKVNKLKVISFYVSKLPQKYPVFCAIFRIFFANIRLEF